MKKKLKHFIFLLYVLATNLLYGSSQKTVTLEVECPAFITINEGAKADSATAGWPKIINNTGGTISTTYFDVLAKGKCPNKTDQITRFFTVRNSAGDQFRCSQIITIKHRDINEIKVVKDTSLLYPLTTAFSSLLVNSALDLSSVIITYRDSLLIKKCTNPMKILRTWTIQDKCNAVNVKKLTTNINLTGYEDSFNHLVEKSNGVCDLDGFIALTPKGEFGPYKYKWSSNDSLPAINNKAPGDYQVTITDRFNCPVYRFYSIRNMGEVADVGGRVLTKNGYHVYPDSMFFENESNIAKACLDNKQVLQYSFNVNKANQGYYGYSFRKVKDALNALSTKDILLIQKHILATKRFTDTLSYYAADVLGNYNVAGSDISELRKLILGVIPTFTQQDPWAFLRADYQSILTPNTTLRDLKFKGVNITTFPKQNIDVLALKIGDVDFSYRESNLQGGQSDSRNKKIAQNLIYKIKHKSDGYQYIEFYLPEVNSLEGIQLGLDFTNEAEITNSQIPSEFYNFTSDRNLRISWSNGGLLSFDDKQALFTIRTRSYQQSNFKLSEDFATELIQTTGNDKIIELIEHNSVLKNPNEEAIITPNPSNGWITLSIQDAVARIDFYDQLGRIVTPRSLGNNQYDISTWNNGIYYFVLETDQKQLLSGKIIKE